MYNDYKELDLSKPLSFQENLKKSIMVTTGSSIFGAIFFFIAYAVTKNIWLLSVGVILVISGVVFMFVVQNIQSKYSHLMDTKTDDAQNK